MIKILIVTHGKLAEGFKDAVNTVFGQSENIEALGLYQGEDINNFHEKISRKIENIDGDDSLIIFTDIVSASPYTQSQIAIKNSNLDNEIRLIGNTSFPMLMEAINGQILDSDFDETVNKILDSASEKVDAWNLRDMENIAEDDDF